MAAKIIWYTVSFGCAILFFSIGVYAQRLKKPMWFWSGTEVDASQITDVKRYNHENGIMWKLYSLWFVASGLAEIWNSVLALILLVLSLTAGIPILVYSYLKIEKKYKVQ